MEKNNLVLQTLIVSNKSETQDSLINLLSKQYRLNIIGVVSTIWAANNLISQTEPDLIFLDADLPNQNVFHFLERAKPYSFDVIFTSACDKYALQAFHLNAIDYILKPISEETLQIALEKAFAKKTYKTYAPYNLNVLNPRNNKVVVNGTKHEIILRNSDHLEIISIENILFIEAKRSYSKIFFTKNKSIKQIIMSNPVNNYEMMLPNNIFFRIHRSYLINRQHVQQIVHYKHHAYIVLHNTIKLPISRRRYAALVSFLYNRSITITI